MRRWDSTVVRDLSCGCGFGSGCWFSVLPYFDRTASFDCSRERRRLFTFGYVKDQTLPVSMIRVPISSSLLWRAFSRSRETGGGDDRIRTGDGGFADPCLTTWPRRRRRVWSGRRDLNPRPSPWQGDALPLRHFRSLRPQALWGTWCRGGDSNSYALNEHSALNAACLPVPPPRRKSGVGPPWQEWRDSNPRPTVLETVALPN